MEPQAVVTTPAPAPGTNIKESPEFQEAIKQERERIRLEFDAEYRRKKQELEAQHPVAPKATPQDGADYFEQWGERHGLPAAAGRELMEGAVNYVTGQVLPAALKPLTQATKRSELRSQRADLRASNPKIARLDDKYHAEAMKLLDPMDPSLIGAESYARALHMVIGQNIEVIEAEAAKGAWGGERQPEIAPGPEPLPDAGGGKPGKVLLSAYQKQLCEEKGWDEEFFVDLIRSRARKLEAGGMSKPDVRRRLGDQLGGIEF